MGRIIRQTLVGGGSRSLYLSAGSRKPVMAGRLRISPTLWRNAEPINPLKETFAILVNPGYE